MFLSKRKREPTCSFHIGILMNEFKKIKTLTKRQLMQYSNIELAIIFKYRVSLKRYIATLPSN